MLNSIEPLSVIICCYNGVFRLPATLESLARQESCGVLWEIVLVDNASTDGTADLARKIWSNLNAPVPLKVVREAEPGLSIARLRGSKEASYDNLAFVDDDNLLDPCWVCLAARIMAGNPDIGLLGSGNIEAVFEHQTPEWVKQFEPILACGSTPGHALQIKGRGATVAGAGMVTRKDVFREMREHYGDFISSDRKGSNTSSGGDIEFAYVVSILGWKIATHPNLRIKHIIPAGRTQAVYLKKLVVCILRSTNELDPLRRFAAPTTPPSSALQSYLYLLALVSFHASAEVLRMIGIGRKSVDIELVVAGTRISRLVHLLGFFNQYRRNFSKAKRFAISLRNLNRA